jgi:hypothetical protein
MYGANFFYMDHNLELYRQGKWSTLEENRVNYARQFHFLAK